MKKIHIALILFLCFGVKAQTMFVRPITGTQSFYPVSDIQKLTFENGNLNVNNTNGASGTFALAGNRYINFTDLTLGTVSQQVVKNSFYVYPNPTTTVLNIANDDTSQTITNLEIISLEGRVLMKQNTSQVDIASLPIGLYFCKITTNNISQIIKFLKQ
jgi:hypothetical protein